MTNDTSTTPMPAPESLVLYLDTPEAVLGAQVAAKHAEQFLVELAEFAESTDETEIDDRADRDSDLVLAFRQRLNAAIAPVSPAEHLKAVGRAHATAKQALVAAQTEHLRSVIREGFPEITRIEFSSAYVNGRVIALIDHVRYVDGAYEEMGGDDSNIHFEMQMLVADYPESHESWCSGDGVLVVDLS